MTYVVDAAFSFSSEIQIMISIIAYSSSTF